MKMRKKLKIVKFKSNYSTLIDINNQIKINEILQFNYLKNFICWNNSVKALDLKASEI